MIHKIKEKIKRQNLDGLIVSCSYNVSYLADFKSREAYLLISEKGNIYWTDSRYIEEVKENSLSLKGRGKRVKENSFRIEKINGSVFDSILKFSKKLKLRKLGFEAEHLSFSSYQKLKDKLKGGVELIPTYNLIEGLRQIKTFAELDKIKEAARITIEAVNFIKEFISPGRKEIEIVGELERFIRYNRATGASFDIIVASGANSSFPHHISGNRIIKDNQPVLIDIGVEYLGYKSDLTRVFFLGKIDILLQKIYNIVLEAQRQAIEKIKPGVLILEIDKVSRRYIEEKGYGRFFSHSLGHGIGLQVHEAPRISQKTNEKLKEGMVFTIEPAIYLPGKFGVRIEDMVVVTKKGVEVISGSLNK